LKIEAKYQNKFINKKKKFTQTNLFGCIIFTIILGGALYYVWVKNFSLDFSGGDCGVGCGNPA
jgi:prolipoprotein diacylglyceryltransferase